MMFPLESSNDSKDTPNLNSNDLPPMDHLTHSVSNASFSTTCTTDMDNVSLSSGNSEDDFLSGMAEERPPSGDSGSESDVESLNNDEKEDDGCDAGNNRVMPAQMSQGAETKMTKKRRKGSKGSEKKKKKFSFERRNIRQIMNDKQLEQNTLTAQQEELERKKRLNELKKNMKAQQELEEKEEKDSFLKSLLEDEEDATQDSDCMIVGSSKKDVVVVSSDEETKRESDGEEEDQDNSGSHVNDLLNKKNEDGRVLVNVGHPDDEPDLFLAPQVAYTVKPHQIGGIRFLYDNLVESLSRFHTSPGFGCILAHSMGLGKTIQVVGFVDVLLRCTDTKKVLIIVPINTLQNWVSEFNMWIPSAEVVEGISKEEVLPRQFEVHVVNDAHKTIIARAKVIESWCNKGGVLLMGYEMYRLLATRKARSRANPFKVNKGKKPLVIDLDEEDRNHEMQLDMQAALLDPGPDMIICDEGHRIKNSHAGISQALKNIRTRRRVVLTGYPLQNNLLEYWCMVDFVRPNFLGTKTEFSNMFERPINNGQCQDSTQKDIQLMRARAHVLHSLLEGFVQRRSHQVLKDALPPKEETVLLIRMSTVQRCLYREFMDYMENGLSAYETNNPLKAFAVCCKIWNHPDILNKIVQRKQMLEADNDLDLADSESTKNGDSLKKRKKKTNKQMDLLDKEKVIKYDWANRIMENYTPYMLENGGKMVLLFNIIETTLAVGEKLLVFSQSLFTLDTIEDMLSRMKVPIDGLNENWSKNKTYYRLDGSTSSMEREKLINQFNDPENKNTCLFLLSTRAGCLGINLIGANRVIVLDASWNPCHDCQAICRVYRYGQVRPCFIYRFVTDNTMEKKIYDRQVNKQGMSDRVVDELQPQNNFTRKEVDTLLQYEDKDLPVCDFTNLEKKCSDPVLYDVLTRNGHWVTKEPFTHESLLIDRKDYKMSKMEKRIAKMAYEREKRLNVSYTRPSYSAFYNKPTGLPPQPMLNPIYSKYYTSKPMTSSSLRPSMSTPLPRPAIPAPTSRPGVSVQQIITTTDIILPGTNTATDSSSKISAGEKVFVIKTPKGVYLRTTTGRIFAVRKNGADKDSVAGGAVGFNSYGDSSLQPPMSYGNSGDNSTLATSSGGSMLHNILQPRSNSSNSTPYPPINQSTSSGNLQSNQSMYGSHMTSSYNHGMLGAGFGGLPATQPLPPSSDMRNNFPSMYGSLPGTSNGNGVQTTTTTANIAMMNPSSGNSSMSGDNNAMTTSCYGGLPSFYNMAGMNSYDMYNTAANYSPMLGIGTTSNETLSESDSNSMSSFGSQAFSTTSTAMSTIPSDSILGSSLAQNITGTNSPHSSNCATNVHPVSGLPLQPMDFPLGSSYTIPQQTFVPRPDGSYTSMPYAWNTGSGAETLQNTQSSHNGGMEPPQTSSTRNVSTSAQ